MKNNGFIGYFDRQNWLLHVNELEYGETLTVYPRENLSELDATLAVREQYGKGFKVWTHGNSLHVSKIDLNAIRIRK